MARGLAAARAKRSVAQPGFSWVSEATSGAMAGRSYWKATSAWAASGRPSIRAAVTGTSRRRRKGTAGRVIDRLLVTCNQRESVSIDERRPADWRSTGRHGPLALLAA